MHSLAPESDGTLTKVQTAIHIQSTKQGGVGRAQAVSRATASLDDMTPVLLSRIDAAMQRICDLVHAAKNERQPEMDELRSSVAEVRDLGGVVRLNLLSAIAAMLCDILKVAIEKMIAYPTAAITVFIDAMVMATGDQYRHLSEADVPELMSGLAQVEALVCASK